MTFDTQQIDPYLTPGWGWWWWIWKERFCL